MAPGEASFQYLVVDPPHPLYDHSGAWKEGNGHGQEQRARLSEGQTWEEVGGTTETVLGTLSATGESGNEDRDHAAAGADDADAVAEDARTDEPVEAVVLVRSDHWTDQEWVANSHMGIAEKSQGACSAAVEVAVHASATRVQGHGRVLGRPAQHVKTGAHGGWDREEGHAMTAAVLHGDVRCAKVVHWAVSVRILAHLTVKRKSRIGHDHVVERQNVRGRGAFPEDVVQHVTMLPSPDHGMAALSELSQGVEDQTATSQVVIDHASEGVPGRAVPGMVVLD